MKREKIKTQKHFLENQKIIEIQKKNNKPFFNYSMTGYIQQKMTVKEFVDYEIVNGKMIVKEHEKKIVYMTYSQHQHNIFKDNHGTKEYKENFNKIQNHIDWCIKNPFKFLEDTEHYVLQKVIENLGFITTPHSLAELLNLDVKIILKEIINCSLPCYQLGQKIFIPTYELLNFIKNRKVIQKEFYQSDFLWKAQF